MKKFLRPFSYILSIALSLIILYLAFSRSNIDESWQLIKTANYWFLVPVLLCSLGGNIIRALRWKLLLPDHKVATTSLLLSNLAAYCVNYGIPRLGEFTRCWVIQKREKISFGEIAGTVIIERLVDIISLLLIVISVILLKQEQFSLLYQTHFSASIQVLFTELSNKPIYITAFLLFTLLFVVFLFIFRKKILTFFNNIQFFNSLLKGLKSCLEIEHRKSFLLYTILIWISYFGTSYFVFFAVDEGSSLPLEAGMAVLAFGSIARTIPMSAGSAGLYHIVVIYTLSLYGLSQSPAEAIAILIHGVQMLFFIFTGGASLLFLAIENKTKD